MSHTATILLLGSGELGREFVISAKRLGAYVVACDAYDDAPAMQLADAREVFSMLDGEKLREAAEKHRPDYIVPEIEAIRTSVLAELEDEGFTVVPSARAAQLTMNRDAIRDLSRQLGHEPSDEEIKAHTGLDEKEYQEFLCADSSEAIESLDELLQSGHEHFPDTTELFEERLIKERVMAQALARLDERERLVLTLYYQHELSLKEIALVLEVSDARVCQLSKQAIGKACRFLGASDASIAAAPEPVFARGKA